MKLSVTGNKKNAERGKSKEREKNIEWVGLFVGKIKLYRKRQIFIIQ